VALRDYFRFHDEYEQLGSPLHVRLLIVQDLLAQVIDEAARGPVRLISMCAGQGRDVVTVARRHRRGGDLVGRLVELDPRNAVVAQRAVEAFGLDSLEVVEGDAGVSDAYAGATPADVVLACGMLGNMTDEDNQRTIEFLPALCSSGASVIWTRSPFHREGILEDTQRWFEAAGFENTVLVVPEGGFGVGMAVLTAEPRDFEPGRQLFTFNR
jgi:hypothetical protein